MIPLQLERTIVRYMAVHYQGAHKGACVEVRYLAHLGGPSLGIVIVVDDTKTPNLRDGVCHASLGDLVHGRCHRDVKRIDPARRERNCVGRWGDTSSSTAVSGVQAR